ncbi:MAG: AsmA family protein, partial [Rhodobacteraceae bacterium]|nr:AsmA family protein [Paracoccaceae bacterium]
MAKLLKKLLVAVLVLGVLVVGAGAVFVSVFDANDYKAEVSDYVAGQTGRAFRIGGDMELSLWPDIGFAIGGVEMPDARGFGKRPFLKVDEARVIVRLWPLLSGEVQVAGVGR